MKETIEQLSAEHEKVSRQVEDKSRDVRQQNNQFFLFFLYILSTCLILFS